MDVLPTWVTDGVTGYQATNKRRAARRIEWAMETGLKPKFCPEDQLPQYEPTEQQAWAVYRQLDREGALGEGRAPGRPSEPAECGTVKRYHQHIYRRRQLRRTGDYTPEQIDEMEPIDDACRQAFADREA